MIGMFVSTTLNLVAADLRHWLEVIKIADDFLCPLQRAKAGKFFGKKRRMAMTLTHTSVSATRPYVTTTAFWLSGGVHHFHWAQSPTPKTVPTPKGLGRFFMP